MQDRMRKLTILLPKAIEYIVENGEKKVPETGPFSRLWCTMSLSEQEHRCYMGLECAKQEEYAVQIGVIVAGTDKLIFNFMFFGSKPECLSWLQDEANLPILREQYIHLLNRADKMD